MLVATLALLALQDVLTVDPFAGPYFEIRAAMAAAAPGDVIRVAPGTYGYFGAIGKGVTVVASSPAGPVRVLGTVRVQDVPLGQAVVFAGLTVEVPLGDAAPALIVASTHGSVRIEDSTFRGHDAAAVTVTDAADVALVDCDAQGWSDSALVAERSSLRLFGGIYRGANQGLPCADGHAGIRVSSGQLALAGVTVLGGWGGEEDAPLTVCNCGPGAGGDALLADGTHVELLDTTLVPGLGGPAFWCSPGSAGLPLRALGSTQVSSVNGPALTLSASAHLVTEGAPLTLHAAGEPGDLLVLVVGPAAGVTDLPAFVGDLLVGGGTGQVRRLLLGSSPAVLQVTAPAVAPWTVEELHLQPLELRPSGPVLGAPRVVTVVDAAW
jgi:hypothetical protein